MRTVRLGPVVALTIVLCGMAFGGGWLLNAPATVAVVAPIASSAPVAAEHPAPLLVALAPPRDGRVRGLDGDWVYRCADPWEIVQHLDRIGCAPERAPTRFDEVSELGQDVCNKLWDARQPAEVTALGVRCTVR